MTAVVLRDVVARITLDPLFALQVRTNPQRFAAAIKLTASGSFLDKLIKVSVVAGQG